TTMIISYSSMPVVLLNPYFYLVVLDVVIYLISSKLNYFSVSDIFFDSLLYICISFMLFFFFFQAEDGIRDLYVTGVQTCALPICTSTEVCCTSGRTPLSRRSSPARAASATPRSERSQSTHPVNRLRSFHSLRPW